MARRAWLPVLAILAAACASHPVPPAQQPEPAQEETAAEPDLGPWIPSEELLAQARLLGDPDPAIVAEAKARIDSKDFDPVHRRRILRAGLRLLDGDAAVACAARLEYQWMNNAEASRCVDLLLPLLGDENSELDWNEFRSYLGSVDLHRLFAMVPEQYEKFPDADWLGILAACHRMTRPEHLPALVALSRHPNPGVQDGALDCLWTTLPHTDQYRDALLPLFLEWWNDVHPDHPRADAPHQGPGLHPALRALIRYECEGEWKGNTLVADWAARWVAQSECAAADLPALLAMTRADHKHAFNVVAAGWLALGDLDDEASLGILREESGDLEIGTWSNLLVMHSLARRGHNDALSALRRHAAEESEAWMLLADLSPTEAADELVQSIGRWNAANADEYAPPAADALSDADWHGITLSPSAFDGAERALLATDLSACSLWEAARSLPGAFTRAVAREICRRMEQTPDDLEGLDDRLVSDVHVAAPKALRDLLHRWTALPSSPENEQRRDLAWQIRLEYPDETLLTGAVEWIREQGADWNQMVTWRDRFSLDSIAARQPDPALEPVLREIALSGKEAWDEAADALAILQGLPPGLIWSYSQHEPRGLWVDRVLAGEAEPGLLELMEQHPEEIQDLRGIDRSPALHRWVLDAREDSRLPWLRITQELAAAGLDGAREELWKGYRKGRYRWIDGAYWMQLVYPDEPQRVEFWIDEMEAACCRNYKGRVILDNAFEVDVPGQSEARLETRATSMRKWWNRVKDRIVWSEGGHRFVVGPVR